MLTVHNQGRLGLKITYFFSKMLWLEICTTPQNKDLCSSVLGREAIFHFYMVQVNKRDQYKDWAL